MKLKQTTINKLKLHLKVFRLASKYTLYHFIRKKKVVVIITNNRNGKEEFSAELGCLQTWIEDWDVVMWFNFVVFIFLSFSISLCFMQFRSVFYCSCYLTHWTQLNFVEIWHKYKNNLKCNKINKPLNRTFRLHNILFEKRTSTDNRIMNRAKIQNIRYENKLNI